MGRLLAKVASSVDKVKAVEQNRKFFLTFLGMVAAIWLRCSGKIDEQVFKEVFLASLLIFSIANVVAKAIINKYIK